MSSGPDLFVVCKQCGSEVSPYITECPYCGHRLRRRAPKLPRELRPSRSPQRTRWPIFARARPALARRRSQRSRRWAVDVRAIDARPYATIALVAASCVAWVLWRGGYVGLDKLVIAGPLHGDWWKLFTSQLTYLNGFYAFATLLVVAIFGWLLERRHGAAVVLALFLGVGAAGALVANAVYPEPIVSGGNGAALGLLAAWAAPDLEAARKNLYYEGDLLGVAALAAMLLAMGFALREVSWLAGVTGGIVGLVLGAGLHRLDPEAP
jgi:membrane associated rhomboid family serine protease